MSCFSADFWKLACSFSARTRALFLRSVPISGCPLFQANRIWVCFISSLKLCTFFFPIFLCHCSIAQAWLSRLSGCFSIYFQMSFTAVCKFFGLVCGKSWYASQCYLQLWATTCCQQKEIKGSNLPHWTVLLSATVSCKNWSEKN